MTGLEATMWLLPGVVVGRGGIVTGLDATMRLLPGVVVGRGGIVTGLDATRLGVVVGNGGIVTGLATATVANTAITATKTNALKLSVREVIHLTPLGEPCTERVTQKM